MDLPRHERGVRQFFEAWAFSYDRSLLQALFYRRVHAAVLAAVERLPEAPRRVLDLGCGTARLTQDLAGLFPRSLVLGADLSAGMLAAARRRLRREAPSLVQASAYALPLAAGAADLLTSTLSYHWLPDPGRALEEMRRVLRPGGTLVLATLSTHLFRGRFLGQRLVPSSVHLADLRSAGFRVLSATRVVPLVGLFVAR